MIVISGKLSRILFLLSLILLLASCGGGGGIGPTPQPPPTPPPPLQSEAPVKYLFWYDPGTTANLPNLYQTSNTIMLRRRNGEYGQFLSSQFKMAVIGCYDQDGLNDVVGIVEAAKAAGKSPILVLFTDEPDLGSKTPAQINDLYAAYRVYLNSAGHSDVLLAPTFSLYGTPGTAWQWENYFSVPIRTDVIVTDSWYTGASNEIHLVRDRFIRFVAQYDRVNNTRLPIVHVLKAFSYKAAGLDSEDITGEWLRRQLVATTGASNFGPVTYEWHNPTTGELANITLLPLPRSLLQRTIGIGLYKYAGYTSDADHIGQNCPSCRETIRNYALSRGLTIN